MLNSVISDEIQRLSKQYGYEVSCLSEFAKFVLKNQKKQKKLTLKELKEAIFKYFDVNNLKELRQSSEFKLAVQDFGDINFSTLESCEKLYREFIDILPHKIGEIGKDCINEINIKKQKKLTLKELKEAIFKYFDVNNLKELRQSSEFKLAVQDFGDINFSTLESCEKLYREFIDILPHEIGETGKDCINGINIFKYFRPWQVFDLNPTQATESDIKSAYRELSKKYHPDNPKTGNARIFDRINQMYRSILPKTYQTTDQ